MVFVVPSVVDSASFTNQVQRALLCQKIERERILPGLGFWPPLRTWAMAFPPTFIAMKAVVRHRGWDLRAPPVFQIFQR